MNHLTLKVREADSIMVGKPDSANPRSRQVERHRGTECAHSDDQHAAAQQPRLPWLSDLRERQMAGVPLPLIGCQATGHQPPLDLSAGPEWKMPRKTRGRTGRRWK